MTLPPLLPLDTRKEPFCSCPISLLDEYFRVQGRTTWYIEPEEIQRDLDRFIEYYNIGTPTRATACKAGRRR